jgi:hypothetical protein
VRVVGIRCMNQVIREFAMGVEWGCGFASRIGRFGFERRSGWKYVGNRRTWHVLWRLASRRLWRMMGRVDTIYFSISLGGKVNNLSIGLSKRSSLEASTSGSYL